MNREDFVTTRVGIDFGGVIVKHHKHAREDTNLRDSDSAEIAQEGVFEAVREIVSVCSGCVWIVSKAGPKTQIRTIEWLHSVDFFCRTGLSPDHVHFCLERPDKERMEIGMQIGPTSARKSDPPGKRYDHGDLRGI